MAQYFISYIGGDHPSTPDEGRKHMVKYMGWLSSLGEAAISPMNPLADTKTVNPDGSVTDGGISAMSGYTIIETDTLDSALDLAKSCPFLNIGGSLEVSELIQMPEPK
ncbi:MAG: hypothetical protein ACI845_002914 [Gammaproteobacteria bacterium]|jgi:hypothetical protein